jgi:3',5'-cyclic AMP phosphodiesterase CpdA
MFIPSGDSFIVVGDSLYNEGFYKDIVVPHHSSLSPANVHFLVGHRVEKNGNQPQWRSFFNPKATITNGIPRYAADKNTELELQAAHQSLRSDPAQPSEASYYCFDLHDSHFIVLDTEYAGQIGGIFGKQLAWLQNDIEKHGFSARYLFVYTHLPLYQKKLHSGKSLANADELHRLFTKHGVDAVFSENGLQYYVYQRDSVLYIVTGDKAQNFKEYRDARSHHYLLIELLHPNILLIHVLDVRGKLIQTEIVPIS